MNTGYQNISIELQVAKTFDGKILKTLTMRPPQAADILVAENTTSSSCDMDVLVFANLTDTSKEFIQSLEFYDYKQVEAAFNCFLYPIQEHLDRRSSYFPNPPVAK